MTGETVDDFVERTIEENFAVIDDENAMAKFFDVLHVMTGQQCHNAVFLVVNAQKFSHPLLTNDIQPDRRFVQKQHPRLMDER